MVDFKYDVFVSYNHSDKDWVRGVLLHKLKQYGYSTCIDFEDFAIGKPAIIEMERAVVESRRTLLVFTPEYLKSDWCNFENILAQTLDPAARDRRLLPIVLKKCDLPLRFKILLYRNMENPAVNDWEKLMSDLI